MLSINTVIFGLQVRAARETHWVSHTHDPPPSHPGPPPPPFAQLLFLEPNPEYPANPTATEAFCANRELFNNQVRQVLRGGWFLGMDFPCHLELRTLPSKRRSCEPDFESTHEELDSELGAMCLESEHLDREIGGWSPARKKRPRVVAALVPARTV